MNYLSKLINVYFVLFFFIICTSFRHLPLPGYQVGDKAMNFKLKNIDGKIVSLNDNASAKGYILVFTCNHCPYAKAYEDRIIELHNQFSAKGYPVIAINPNDKDIEPQDSYEEMVNRASEHHYPFPYLYDDLQIAAKDFKAQKTPHAFVVWKENGAWVIKYNGAIDDNGAEPNNVKKQYVAKAIDAILSGIAIETTETKSIGCQIHFRK